MTHDPFQAINVTSIADDDRKLEEKAKELLDTPSVPHLIDPQPNNIQDRCPSSPRPGGDHRIREFFTRDDTVPMRPCNFGQAEQQEGIRRCLLEI